MARSPVAILELEDVTIGYQTDSALVPVVRNLSLAIDGQESFGLVGESGSGKSTLAMAAIGYLASNGRVLRGRILLAGQDVGRLSRKEMARIWGKTIGVVYQNPSTALNPSLTIGRQLAETARVHGSLGKRESWRRAVEMLHKVTLPQPEVVARQYPHQLSGGMLQRCVIAMALINNPRLLILDEPTTALDVTTQAVVLDLVAELKRQFRSAILYITHDLAVVAKICDRVGVMYAGQLLEVAPTRELFKSPRHPYTLSLLECIPRPERHRRHRFLPSIPGLIPSMERLPTGCIFHPRCEFAVDTCRQHSPPLVPLGDGRWLACPRWDQVPRRRREPGQARAAADGRNRPVLLEVMDVTKHYRATQGYLAFRRRSSRPIRAVDGLSFTLRQGNTLGVVGESGCGKTTLARTIIGLIAPTSGRIRLHGHPLEATTHERSRKTLKKLQMVFQNPDASLNPRNTVGEAIARPARLLLGLAHPEAVRRARQLIDAVHLPAHYYHRLPAELSGGEKQRIAIARAFAAEPELILLDEPLSALDVSVQASLINLLFQLQQENGTTYLFISHDLAAVQHFSDEIAVLYLGRMVEWGPVDAVFASPHHPYTEALLSAIPIADPDVEQNNIRLRGSVPNAMDIPSGCAFHPRCPRCLGALCEQSAPPWHTVDAGKKIRCHIPPESLHRLQNGGLKINRNPGQTL